MIILQLLHLMPVYSLNQGMHLFMTTTAVSKKGGFFMHTTTGINNICFRVTSKCDVIVNTNSTSEGLYKGMYHNPVP